MSGISQLGEISQTPNLSQWKLMELSKIYVAFGILFPKQT